MPGAKLDTCLVRLALRLHLPQKILACLSLSRVVLWENLAPAEPESSVQICPSGKSQLNFSPLVQEAGGESFSMGWTIAWILIQVQVQSQVLGK